MERFQVRGLEIKHWLGGTQHHRLESPPASNLSGKALAAGPRQDLAVSDIHLS
jgi:hypothetical protein